ncbi:MAG: CoA transferase, partial [Chloroflexi bacterium]|nr:CoA transferase [Chloroflexota bacterium]
LTTIVSGPYAAAILADLGADGIKIEPPGGENSRRFGEDPSLMMGSLTAHIMNLQRNKRGMVVDLRSEGGREVFEGLVRWADVVLDNYRPGVTGRLRIDYPSLKALNPRVIACAVTGYGGGGPGRGGAARAGGGR